MISLRPKQIAVTGGILLAAAAASLSDTTPILLRRLSSAVLRVGRVIDTTLGFEGLDRRVVPLRTNQLAHLLGWAAITLVLTMVWKRLPLGVVAVSVFLISAAIEPLQSALSATRSFSFEDIAVNAGGVTLGVALATIWRIGSTIIRGDPPLKP